MLFGRKSASEAAAEAAAASPSPVQATASEGVPPANTNKRLGQVLIDEGLITTGQLEKALEEQGAAGGFLGQILVKQGAVTQAAVSSCLVKQCKIPHLSLLDYEISSEVLALIPEATCQKYHLLPIDKLGRILTVAMVDPLDNEALDEIKAYCPDLKIKPILCNWEHYELVASRVFSGRDAKGGGGHQMTAESLGLGKLPAAQKPAERPPAATTSSTTTTTTTTTSPAPPSSGVHAAPSSAPAGISAQDLSAAMRDAMQDAVKALAAQTAPREVAPGISGEEISAAIRGAMKEAVQSLATVAPQPGAAPVIAPVQPAIDMQELGAVLRDAVQQAVSAAVKETRPAPMAVAQQPTAPAGVQISPEQMASLLQESVGGAMQEALALMMTQFKAMTPRRDEGQQAEALAAAVRDSVREALQQTIHAQHEQGNRLAEIAEATLQSVQQTSQMVESASTSRQGEQDLLRPPKGRHASVSAFRGGASGTMDNDGRVTEALESHRPAEAMVFDSFVPGNINAFTFRVCQQVAGHPGAEFNPLFLFGHVGAGKTHLISAIGNHVLRASPNARVGYVSASHFARRLKEAMLDNALDAFRENYAHWDVLILDDIQFLAGRVEAQEEFFHIFNALHDLGRQIIIASDKSPDRLGLLEQRLVSRFTSGIVVELKAPEWEARMAILKQQVKLAGAQVPEPILSMIAMRVPDDVRKMTGSLRKIIAYAQLVGKELSCEAAEEILSHLGAEAAA